MLLTPKQIAALRKILDDASTALAITTFGLDVSPGEFQRLVDEGYVDEDQLSNLVRVAFTAGAEEGRQEVQQAFQFARRGEQVSFDEFLGRRMDQVPLSEPEKRARELAATRAGQYCVGLGNRWSDQLHATVINADVELANRTRGIIRDKTAMAIEERKTRGQLRSDLRQATRDWSRDWERIANTELQTAHQEGVFESVAERHGMEEMLAKVPDPGACDSCKRLYLENWKPKARPASWWAEQGTNYGRKQKDWVATIGAAHPHCLLPGSRILTTRGELPVEQVVVGDLVLTGRGRWMPVMEVSSRYYSGMVSELDGLRVTEDHPLASACSQWDRADSFGEGDGLVKILFKTLPSDLNSKDRPSVFSKESLFASILFLLSSSGVPIAAVNLYRDLAIGLNKINEITADDDVVKRIDPEIVKSLGYTFFEIGEGATLVMLPESSNDFGIGNLSSPDSIMGRFRNSLPLFFTDALHSEMHRFGLSALHKASLSQSSHDGSSAYPELDRYLLYGHLFLEVQPDDLVNRKRNFLRSGTQPSPVKSVANCRHGHANVSSDFADGDHFLKMQSDNLIHVDVDLPHAKFIAHPIVNVKSYKWSGYVRNLAVLEDESYVVDGFLSHNCQCQLVRCPAGWHFTEDWELAPPGGEKSVAAASLKKGGPPAGFQPAPHSKHGGYRKKAAEGWEYWYPEGTKEAHRHVDKKRVERKERLAAHRKLIKLGGEYETDGKYVVVLPDASEPGKVRTQTFDEDGFWGHQTYKDLDDLAFDTLPYKGKWKPSPGILNKLSTTETWAEGMARTLVVQVLNSLGYYRQKEDQERINKYVDKHGFRAAADALQGWSEDSKKLSDKTRKLLSKAARRWGDLQKAYKLHYRTTFAGFPISVENRKGSYRRWKDPGSGEEGKTFMSCPYGYINLPQADAVDGDKLDVFLGPDQKAPMVYVVHQLKAPEFKVFDEFKIMLGFANRSEAERAYLANYDSPDFHGSITEVPIEDFRADLVAGKYKGKRIAKAHAGGDAAGIGYTGWSPDVNMGSGAWMVDKKKPTTKDRIERIIDMTSLMDWMKEFRKQEKKAGRKRIVIHPSQFDSHLGGTPSHPNPPTKTAHDPTLSEMRRQAAERNKERLTDWANDKDGVKESLRELHKWHL